MNDAPPNDTASIIAAIKAAMAQLDEKALKGRIDHQGEDPMEAALQLLWPMQDMSPFVPILNEVLVHKHHRKHQEVAKILQDIKSPSSIPYLDRFLSQGFDHLWYKGSDSLVITQWCSHALRSIGTPTAIAVIVKYTRSADEGVRRGMLYRIHRMEAARRRLLVKQEQSLPKESSNLWQKISHAIAPEPELSEFDQTFRSSLLRDTQSKKLLALLRELSIYHENEKTFDSMLVKQVMAHQFATNTTTFFLHFFPIVSHILFYKPKLTSELIGLLVEPLFANGLPDATAIKAGILDTKHHQEGSNPYFLTSEGAAWVEYVLPSIQRAIELEVVRLQKELK